jgi:DNA-binding response OmpR family regulator
MARTVARTVVVVEDDPDLREALGYILPLEGFAPVCIADGEAALEYLRHSPSPALVLLDLTLPKVDGAHVREILQRDPRLRAVPVVILSSRIDTQVTARRLGTAYLTKPFDVPTLVDTVRQHATSR